MRRILRSLSAFVPVLLFTSQAVAQSKTSRWSAPQHLGCDVNSSSLDTGPALSRDGLSLFFGSNRPGGQGGFDIWVSQRASVDDPWGPPRNVAAINTPNTENIPVLSRDQHWLYFNGNRHAPGSAIDVDIYASYREDIRDDFAWQEPKNLDELRPGINTNGFDAGATLLERGNRPPVLYFSRGPTMSATDIYVSEPQEGGTFATSYVPELSSDGNDQRPSIRGNGRELFFYSNRPGSQGNDIWVSTRSRVTDRWGVPVNLGAPVNGPYNDSQAHIAHDSRSLYFVSDRPGSCGAPGTAANLDIYVSFREDDEAGEQPQSERESD